MRLAGLIVCCVFFFVGIALFFSARALSRGNDRWFWVMRIVGIAVAMVCIVLVVVFDLAFDFGIEEWF